MAGKHGRKRLAEGITFGRYVLIEELGAGGMGVVYAALDPDLNRRVALKLIRGDRVESGRADSDSARLLREARAMAKLHHPNVVTVHDVGTIDARVFVAMEYVEGSTLKQWLAEGPHPHPRVLDVLTRAGQGLVAAHEAGIIHRDFKPDNVLLGDDETVKVLDFGLARPPDHVRDQQDAEAEASSDDEAERPREFRTRLGVVLGTPLYMAPEQHRGLALDERSDQFSFCAVAYEALYGQRPFTGRTRHAVAMQACKGQLAKVPEGTQVPAHVRAAVARGLAPEPGDRWPSMQALLEALATDPAEARKRMGLATGAIAMGVAGVVALMWPRAADDPCPAEVAEASAGWDESHGDALRERVATAGTPWASTSAETTTALADAWIQRWRDERLASCQATHVHHDQSARRGTTRAQCLDLALAAATEALDRVEAVDAVATASRLPDPVGCREDARLESVDGAAAGGDALRDLEVLAALPVSPASLESARATVEAATTANDDVTLGLAQLEHARQLAARPAAEPEDADAVRTSLQTAAQIAVGLGDPELAVRAWTALAELERTEGRLDFTRRWLAYADARIEQMTHPRRLQAALHLAHARTLADAKDHERAIERTTAALDLWREEVGPEHLDVAQALDELARTLENAGRPDEAVAPRAEAARMRTALLGEGHP